MLWNLIHDFFVQHIFGGHLYTGGTYEGFIGDLFSVDGDFSNESTLTTYIKIDGLYGDSYGDYLHYMCLGDYLSTIATIISITIIVVLCCLFIKKIVSTISNLMSR